MSESTQHSRIANYIHEIIQGCQNDPVRLEVATVNFTSLITAMKLYERAPSHFKAIIDEADNPPAQLGQPTFMAIPAFGENANMYRNPVIGPLEEMFGRKLKQRELATYGKIVAERLSLKLDRETKRNRAKLLRWYSDNWEALRPMMQEIIHSGGFPMKGDLPL
jgi:hypothetical protein